LAKNVEELVSNFPPTLRAQMTTVAESYAVAGSACFEAVEHIWILLVDVHRFLIAVERILRFMMNDITAVALVTWARLVLCATIMILGLVLLQLMRMLSSPWVLPLAAVYTIAVHGSLFCSTSG
jgi:hypothetical protein